MSLVTMGNPLGHGRRRTTPNPYFNSDESSSFEGLGIGWLTSHNYVWHRPDQAYGVGWALAHWLEINGKPGRVAQAQYRVDKKGLPEEIIEWDERSNQIRRADWTKAKDAYVKEHIEREYVYQPCKQNEHKGYEALAPDPDGGMGMVQQQCSCVLPRPAVIPVNDESSAISQRDAVFAKVSGKGLPDYEARPAPPGHKWVLEREKGKPRGLPFRKGKDARRYQEQSRG
jgi:hypothetical protein